MDHDVHSQLSWLFTEDPELQLPPLSGGEQRLEKKDHEKKQQQEKHSQQAWG